jgi:hypothetical protein
LQSFTPKSPKGDLVKVFPLQSGLETLAFTAMRGLLAQANLFSPNCSGILFAKIQARVLGKRFSGKLD